MMGTHTGSTRNDVFILSQHRLKRRSPPERAVAALSILKENRNYWRKERAARARYLIDAAAFYKAFYLAVKKAQKQVIIVGWDTDSRVELLVGDDRPEGGPVTLRKFLMEELDKKPDLKIYILSWDYSIIYTFEREYLSRLKFEWLGHERLRFQLDDTHPLLGSHHQKVVVVDDKIAFSGGLDICGRRWDTPEHYAFDERRVDPGGTFYNPFHDVQLMVEGPVAAALGDLVRERWWQATGESLPAPESGGTHWPEEFPPDVEDLDIAISRTVPGSPRRRPVIEVERLFVDAIQKAQRFIYIENQYFTSTIIAKALARRLREKDGPDIVIVLPRNETGWIEESTMGVLRGRVMDYVHRADQHGRLGIYNPIVPGLERGYVKVHSKVMIVDDEFCRVGSANLNHRSMGLDTECDLSFEAHGDPAVRASIGSLRARLLSEHLGVEAEEFEARFRMNGSLHETVESFRGAPRTLVELDWHMPDWLDRLIPPGHLIDPITGFRPGKWLGRWYKQARERLRDGLAQSELSRSDGFFAFGVLFLVLVAALLFWRVSGFRELVRPEVLADGLDRLRGHPLMPLAVIGGFVGGSLLMVPLTAMILATVFAFTKGEAFALALAGSMASAFATYGVGWLLGRRGLDNAKAGWLQKVRAQLRDGGVWAVTVVRMIPVAPFTLVNLAAGASRVRLPSYLLGTVFGLLPGLLLLTVLGEWAAGYGAAAWQPYLILAGGLVVMWAISRFLRILLRGRAS